MKVNISISSQCGGERFSCLGKGDLSIIQGGFVLRYDIDGDACELISDNTGISQCRKGNFTYSVKFIPYEKCDFIFTEGGRQFTQTVKVLRADSFITGSGCSVKIIYDGGEVTELSLTAGYI